MLLVMVLGSVVLYADCEMIAMIAKKGNYISWIGERTGNWDDPYDFFQFMKDESHAGGYWPDGPNDDGYGVIYYPEDGSFDYDNQSWFQTDPTPSDNTYYTGGLPVWKDSLDLAEQVIMNNNTEASIVLGHDRQGTGGNGNHPFHIDYNDPITFEITSYTFMHNGNVGSYKDEFYQETGLLNPNWFSLHPSNWEGVNHPDSLSTWIDSELYFHYIVANIEDPNEANGDVIQGIYNALSNPDLNNGYDLIGSNEHANFIMSDGTNLYAYRCTDDGDYDLKYVENDTFCGITSGTAIGTQLGQDHLAIFSPYGDIETIDLADPPDFVSGIIASTTTWDSNKHITYDITVPAGITLNIDAEVTFISHCTFTVNGTVNLHDDSNFELNHASEVLVENDGILFLDWGSIVKGTLPTTYGATQPGHPVGGERQVLGDRIIAKNGGVITTDILNNFTPGSDPSITIGSTTSTLWDGIFIRNPGDEDEFWFVNCDISGIRKLSIENVGLSARNIAKLKLHQTDFHDAGQIVVRDDHELTVHGNVSESEYCYFQNTPAYPIIAYESPVDLNYVHIGGFEEEDGLENGGGIYLYETSRNTSTIKNCKFNYNNGDGIKVNGVAFSEFSDNFIEVNTGFGMLCYDGTTFDPEMFFNLLISNNGYAEYVGWHNTFEMEDPDADITILDGDFGLGSDQYLLMNLKWDPTESIDISGTNITNDTHLYPENPELPAIQAWIFSQGGIAGSKELLDSATIDFANQNYSSAKQTLYQLLADYLNSPEAVSAVYYLYHIENLADADFSGLRDYLIGLNVEEDTYLYSTIKKISAKTLMKEKDYIAAIDLLESIIINSELPDEVILAMIDQGYCYLELADEGERGLPVNCTIKTATLDKYQAKVRELETQFSFYPEENNQDSTPIAGDILSLANYPNPFNPSTTISFNLSAESNVDIVVYNVKGQKVKQLVKDQLSVGQHSIEWNGKDTNNKSVSSGMYFYKISAGKSSAMRKMLLLK